MDVQPITSMKYKVSCGTKTYVVDLNANTCLCREFDLDLIPCAHAAAAISKSKQSLFSYVSSYYRTETLREIYSGEVMPILHPDEWSVPVEVKSRQVLTPPQPTQAERPRTSRIESCSRLSRACSRCNQSGHYRSKCKEAIPISQDEHIASNESEVVGSRRRKCCGIYGEVGHNRRRCTKSVMS
ncbi:uncharacterized protein LOC131004191 [Salvia miltiorrhiza]|uniref:uncharacterized protein LOC131004191 n=1 Tax=Salvia miltiorrhiza TaxID=226208 RepID=UPI0025ACC68B|nr:uncharacterized protein LOC131004191 [Salvia miltiorrhiza]